MKLIRLLCGFLMISSTAFAQTISLKAKKMPLENVFSVIQEQTGYRVSGKKELLKSGKPLTLAVEKMPLDDFLKILVRDQVFTYSVIEKNIIISAKVSVPVKGQGMPVKMQSAPVNLTGQPMLLNGKVLDQTGKPIGGVSVALKSNPRVMVMTNVAGEFQINTEKDAVIQVSHIAFEPRELTITQAFLDQPSILLKERNNDLMEVTVNKGYYSTTKALNTGSVTTITAKDIDNQPVTNVLQALQSRVPGLIIDQQSGNPGSNFNIQLRGKNSLNQSNPLFIVDGTPFSMDALGQVGGTVNNLLGNLTVSGAGSAAGTAGLSPLNAINPEDIESVTILKDADATAIYGSLGANGVILITTKKAKSGPLRVNGNFNMGFSNPSRMPEFMNTEQYLVYRRSAFQNSGKTPGAGDYDLNGTWDTNRYTQWGKELIGRHNINSNGRISLSGGNQQTQFQLGIGHTRMTPPYDGDFANKRTSLSFSINNTSVDNKFRLTMNGNYGHDANTLPGLDISSFLSLPPNAPDLLKPDGSLNWWHPTIANPYAALKRRYNALTKNFQINGVISYQLLPTLTIRSNIGYSDVQFDETRLNPASAINPAETGSTANALVGDNKTNSWIIEPQAEFSTELWKGKFTALAGATFKADGSEGKTISANGFASDAVLTNLSAASRFVINNRYAEYRYNAIFGRINYALMDRYVINITGRRDGSSRFASGRQFGNFGAIGVAWVFSNESWANQLLPILSFGKLRGSYGITGNDQIGNYRYLNTFTSSNNISYLGSTGLLPTRLANSDYGWESNKKLEVATELGFFNDRVLLTAAWYRNRSSDQLVSTPLAPATGGDYIQQNLPALLQNTGWEFDLISHNLQKKDFTWTSTLNLTIGRIKLIDFPDLESFPADYSERYVVGRSLTLTTPLYHMTGVNPVTGLYEFLGKDGKLTSTPTADDRYVRADLNPKYYGGFGNSIRYKNLQLDVQLQFVKKRTLDVFYKGTLPFSGMENLPGYFQDEIWLKEGDHALVQRLSAGGGFDPVSTAVSRANLAALQSDGNIVDGSYIRCKNVALSWQLSESWLKPVHLKQLRLYAQAQNLFTITNYRGFDPESQGSVLPPLRTLVFGLQFTL
jgi:TonB-linked SusC/RagA family outer membrane protein